MGNLSSYCYRHKKYADTENRRLVGSNAAAELMKKGKIVISMEKRNGGRKLRTCQKDWESDGIGVYRTLYGKKKYFVTWEDEE